MARDAPSKDVARCLPKHPAAQCPIVIQLPGGSPAVLLHGAGLLAVTSLMSIILVLPFGFFASLGRGYLLPIGIAVLTMILGNLSITLGWGEYFPWAVPAMLFQEAHPGLISYALVALTGMAGVTGTYLWWKYANQNR